MDVTQLFHMLEQIPKTKENTVIIEETRKALEQGDYQKAIEKINMLYKGEEGSKDNNKTETAKDNQTEQDNEESQAEGEDERYEIDENGNIVNKNNDVDEMSMLELFEDEPEDDGRIIYPDLLMNQQLEETYLGMLLNNPKAMSMYYILFDDNYFADPLLLNMYKSILFTEGQAYAPEKAKNQYNFAKETSELNEKKEELKEEYYDKNYDFEKIYVELRKLFVLRRSYNGMPIKATQDRIVEIINYYLYDQMSIQEVEDAIEQVTVTQKFKSSILSENVSSFLMEGDNTLTSGLKIPFKILSSVFKGLRRGETMSFAMPSNYGKSRFTINLAAYIAFVHKKKVLVISNEMSEEKMKLCLITTVLNNPEMQKIHGQDIIKTEGELLEFKFKPDDPNGVNVDEDGYVLKEPNETQIAFAQRLEEISEDYRKTIAVTRWLDSQIKNSIYFINITDHTNDELKKVIVNYYYKEKIEYMFYDTMKCDTENIGNADELKKTATILSNMAQEFRIFIGSTMQLTETSTLPVNLTINDLAVSKTVKEVLDTLCLFKQIQREDMDDYEYSLEEVGNECMDLEKFRDPNVRYYVCVIDKNRAGAKPKLLFRLNLAYNRWEEVGYIRLKNKKGE